MSRTPIRTLTVTAGRQTLGTISQFGSHAFEARVAGSGQKLGPFASQAEAALAIETAHSKPAAAEVRR